MHKELNKVTEMKNTLICWAKNEIAKGCETCCTEELGEVIDMIKDLTETEEKCVKTMYYMNINEAMDEYDDDRYGYNSRRYASGQYAPAGKGHLGYIETPHMTMPHRSQSGNIRSGYYSQPFEDFRMAKRNYTQSGSESDKKRMHDHANEHIMNSVDSIREMWKDADPELKHRIKNDMSSLVNEMNM